MTTVARRVKTPAWAAFLKETFSVGFREREPIEVYSKVFSYFSLAMTEVVGLFLAMFTGSWPPIVFTTFLGLTSFMVSSTFDAEAMRMLRKKCYADAKRVAERDRQ